MDVDIRILIYIDILKGVGAGVLQAGCLVQAAKCAGLQDDDFGRG
jgi:hypothetical protein